MSRQTRTGPAALAVGIALGGVALGAIQAKRKQGRSPDDAPDFALRQRDGEYDLVGRSVTIRKPRDELFRFWRDFGNLARFMENLEKVEVEDAATGRATWHIKGPAGRSVAVRTTIESEDEGRMIAWRSLDGSDVETEGKVTFEDAPGKAVAKAFLREPEIQARHDLKRFKMLMETGEIATSARTKAQTRAAKQENAA